MNNQTRDMAVIGGLVLLVAFGWWKFYVQASDQIVMEILECMEYHPAVLEKTRFDDCQQQVKEEWDKRGVWLES